MEAWYVLHTKPNAEQRVNGTLLTRGFVTYLPMLVFRPKSAPQPLFPAYMFLRCDLDVVDVANLQWIPGLRRILSFGGRPAFVPDDAINLIERKTEEINTNGGLPGKIFKAGDEVVIESGPLRGLHGIFQGPSRPSERVQILIHLLGEANRAEVPLDSLGLVPEDKREFGRHRTTRGGGRRIRNGEPPDGKSADVP